MKPNPILTKSFDFSIEIVKFCYAIQKRENEYIISKQLIRAGTSIGANIEESQGAISKADFIHKLHVSLKEARESNYWLRILKEVEPFNNNLEEIGILLIKCNELISLLTVILKSTKNNLNRN